MSFKFILLLFIGLTGGVLLSLASQEPKDVLIINMNNEAVLPRNFRTTKDPFKFDNQPLPSRQGLDLLHLSGSAQFSEKALGVIIKKLENPESLYIIDLRQESHGFLNGIAVSWYAPRDWGNIGKSLQEVELIEKQLLFNAVKNRHVALHRIVKKDQAGDHLPETISIPLIVKNAETEQEVVFKYGLAYLRIGVTDHMRPSDESVDRFIAFICNLPKERWLHIHCAAGVGRTTTFMAMYDMMTNAKQVSFEEIIKRQWLLGGLNLSRLPDRNKWKYPEAVERLRFLRHFYEYCLTNIDNYQQSWSSYLLHNQKAA